MYHKSKTVLICHNPKVLFIHNYKVAGTSIRYALRNFVPLDQRIISNLLYFIGKPKLGDRYIGLPKHSTALAVRHAIGRKNYDLYFKFGLVRNPWDWEVSKYFYTLKNKRHREHHLVKKMANFSEYIAWRAENYRTQRSFFEDAEGKIIVDYIGKMETIDSVFSEMSTRLSIDIRPVKLNASRDDAKYRQYFDEESRQMIESIYAADIDSFGYEF